jgi:hypothetical protein
VTLQVEVPWVVTPCIVVVGYRRFRGPGAITTLYGVATQKKSTWTISQCFDVEQKHYILGITHTTCPIVKKLLPFLSATPLRRIIDMGMWRQKPAWDGALLPQHFSHYFTGKCTQSCLKFWTCLLFVFFVYRINILNRIYSCINYCVCSPFFFFP